MTEFVLDSIVKNQSVQRRYFSIASALPAVLACLDIIAVGIATVFFARTVSSWYGVFIALAQVIVFSDLNLYWRYGEIFRTYAIQLGRIVVSYLYIFVGYAVFVFITMAFGALPHPDDLLLLLLSAFLITIGFRLVATYAVRCVASSDDQRFLIVGGTQQALRLFEEITDEKATYKYLGFVVEADDTPAQKAHPNLVLGTLENIETIISAHRATHVVFALNDSEFGGVIDQADRIAKLPVLKFMYDDRFGVIRQRYRTRRIGLCVLTAVGNIGQISRWSAFQKRIFDIFSSLFLIVLAAPLMAAISILIKLTSPGPVLYVSDRVNGIDGSTFSFLKFRSMKHRTADHEAERKAGMDRVFSGDVSPGDMTKVLNKSALTPIGQFLRSSSLDELPQLFNILRGDMSLIGPRPSLPYEYARYKPWQKRRLLGKPGLTGLWQVIARSETSFDETVTLDLYYLEHQTIWMDIEILIKTVPVVLMGRGAY